MIRDGISPRARMTASGKRALVMRSAGSGIAPKIRPVAGSVSPLRHRPGRALRSDIGETTPISAISRAAASDTHMLYGTRLALYVLHSIYLYRQLVLIILLSDFQGGCLI